MGIGFGVVIGVALMSIRRRPIRQTAAWLLAVAWVTAERSGPGAGPTACRVRCRNRPGDARHQRRGVRPQTDPAHFRLAHARSEIAAHPRSIELPGRIIPDPNASGYVQAAVGGRLSPPPGGFPRLGTPVNEGDVLAYVTPPMQAIDVSDMRQRQGELDQQIDLVERRLARYEPLAPSGAVARSQLEETRLELEGLKDRRAALDKVRREPEALVAPVSGIIAEGTPVAGQIAQTNAVIFHIVDPARLWVEALSFDAVAGGSRAHPPTAAGSRRSRLRSAARAWPTATSRSRCISRSRATPTDCAPASSSPCFVSDRRATSRASRSRAPPGRAAANGQDFVYEHVTAERFEPRPVRVEPLDGERVLIAAGLEPGKRIVVQGAELLDHVR